MKLVVVALVVAVVASRGHAQSLEECLQQDSISCVQRSLFKRAKEFFERDSLELLSGVSLVKRQDERGARSGAEGAALERELEKAESVAARQSALENYVGEEVGNFFYGRSLKIKFAPLVERIGESARALSDVVPAELKQVAVDVVEGRGKKKLLKSLMPLMLLAKVKLGALVTFVLFSTAVLAKKALVASLLSLAITAFMSMRSVFSKSSHDAAAYSGWSSGGAALSSGWASPAVVPSAGAGWSSGAPATGWADDAHGAYSAQNQAYSAYHH